VRRGHRETWQSTHTGQPRGRGDRHGVVMTAAFLTILLSFARGTAAEEPPAEPEAAQYVGDDMCRSCHEEIGESYSKTAHGWALTETSRPPSRGGCEACHGPGSEHAEAGGGKGVGHLETFAPSTAAPQRSAVCLRCHAGNETLHAFRTSAHAGSGVACTDCHGGHAARAVPLLRDRPPRLCYRCHSDVRASFALPENHRVDQGVVSCIDCHSAHGSRDRMALRGTNNRACFRCHPEIEGPHVFEHQALLTEGCAACHVPHGSVNRHLLSRQQVAQLCYHCHTVTPADHLQPSFRDCTRCHVSIHGSNVQPHFLEQ